MSKMTRPLSVFIARHEEIENITSVKHAKDVNLCYEGIELVLITQNILDGMKFDSSTPELAVRSLAWRFLVSISSTAYECLRLAIQGEYRISFSLMRILIEETVSIRYYEQNPQIAQNELRDVLKSGYLRETKISSKLNALDKKSNGSLKDLYDAISKGASHANALAFPGELIDGKSKKLIKPQEPAYQEEALIMEVEARLLGDAT